MTAGAAPKAPLPFVLPPRRCPPSFLTSPHPCAPAAARGSEPGPRIC